MIDELVVMRLRAEVEVPADDVLAEVNDEISQQHEESGALAALQLTLAGTISVIEVASMNPAPSAMKYFR